MDIKADKIAAPPSGKCDGESCARRAFRLDAQFSGPSRNGILKFSFFSFFFLEPLPFYFRADDLWKRIKLFGKHLELSIFSLSLSAHLESCL